MDAHANTSSSAQDASDDENPQPTRIPRRTPVACTFCRGRKLKCDGRPICANCNRRGLPCSYVPASAASSK